MHGRATTAPHAAHGAGVAYCLRLYGISAADAGFVRARLAAINIRMPVCNVLMKAARRPPHGRRRMRRTGSERSSWPRPRQGLSTAVGAVLEGRGVPRRSPNARMASADGRLGRAVGQPRAGGARHEELWTGHRDKAPREGEHARDTHN